MDRVQSTLGSRELLPVIVQLDREASQARVIASQRTRRIARRAWILRGAKNACSGWQPNLPSFPLRASQPANFWQAPDNCDRNVSYST